MAAASERALALAAEESSLQAAIAAQDLQTVARWVSAGTSSKLRQAAAQAINDPELLRQLIRELRGGKDKSVYKILAAKRDAQIEQTRKSEQLQAEIAAASAALERHSLRAYDSAYGPLLAQFETRWEAVAPLADAEQCRRVQEWIKEARASIAEQARQAAARAAHEEATALAAAEARRLRQEQAEANAATEAEQARLQAEQQRLLAEKDQAEQQAFRQIGELIRKARAALSDGSSSRAAGFRRNIEEKLASAPPLPPGLLSQMQQLDKKLEELKDWKSFSVTPKRAELIAEMESLIGSALEPLALAEQIKSLKEEWRTLGKGLAETLEVDSQRFQAAAQKAYQPCSDYFAAQALLRAENQRRRDALLAELTAFEAAQNWQQPDCNAVIKTLRETKQEWRRCEPVDWAAAKTQQEGFLALTASLQSRVDAVHAANVKQKQSFIELARALLASDDGRKAIDAIKELQQQWKAVGPVPREVDQRLWGEFRQQCDAVFQKRQQDFAAHAAGLEGNKAQAIALCEQVEQIAGLKGPELLERAGALATVRTAFAALGELPRADTRGLRDRFERALDACAESVSRQQALDAESAWGDLFDAANEVRAYRLASALHVDDTQTEALKSAAEAAIAAVPRWPRIGLDALLRQALAADGSGDLAANEAALRMLCIRSELRADLPTPPEDQALRREYQLQRLVQRMGKAAKADEVQLDDLAIEWVTAGPVEEAAYQPLLQRFRRCRQPRSAKPR